MLPHPPVAVLLEEGLGGVRNVARVVGDAEDAVVVLWQPQQPGRRQLRELGNWLVRFVAKIKEFEPRWERERML